jgi:hypothetical protein
MPSPSQLQPLNAAYITKLLVNYRSHPSILDLPNRCVRVRHMSERECVCVSLLHTPHTPRRLFYEGELIPSDSSELRMVTHSLLGWGELPNPDFPVVFHGGEGKDEREGNSPSWFNVLEVC